MPSVALAPMCAIAGIIDLKEKRCFSEQLIRRMLQVQQHRGPDGEGIFLRPGLAFGHNRLAIIDQANGQQPMQHPQQDIVLTFNGEIYNYKALRAELSHQGHVFSTQSDSEIILHAWAQWGQDCLQHLNGMFAFALYDFSTQTVLLARDRLGQKPLYYACQNNCLFFASELKALCQLPGWNPTLNPSAIELYFSFGYIPSPYSIFSNVHKLQAAHALSFCTATETIASLTPRPYWSLCFLPQLNSSDPFSLLGSLLEDSVKLRLQAEVPYGAFLSGGVDSSAIVYYAQQHGADPLQTFSMQCSQNATEDESHFAQQISQCYQTQHHNLALSTNDMAIISQVASAYDEPFADSSALPTYRICQFARKWVTVCLSGDGADESLLGYRRHKLHLRETLIRRSLPAWFRQAIIGPLGALYPKLDWAPRCFRAKTTLQALAQDTLRSYHHSISLMPDALRTHLFSTQLKQALQGYHSFELHQQYASNCPSQDPFHWLQYIDLQTYLADGINTKVDRASMAHGLEVRSPFLDHRLVEFSTHLPNAFKIHRGTGKYLLKQLLQKEGLPPEVLWRKKQGFNPPVRQWLQGPLFQYLSKELHTHTEQIEEFLQKKCISWMLRQHRSGQRDFSAALWAVLMFKKSLAHLLN